MLTIKEHINTIFIMLGQDCNLNCKYCMQHSLITKIFPKRKLNKDIIDFIKLHARKQEDAIDIRFYGGEPLLYFDDIKQIVRALKDENVFFSIITNGRLLTQEIVDFINSNHFNSFALSWDGRNVNNTRYYNVFKKKEDLILQLKNLCISSVISSYNYPNEFIEDILPYEIKYSKQHNKIFPFILDEIVDADARFSDLINFDFDKVRSQSIKMAKKMLCVTLKKDIELTIKDHLYLNLWIAYCNLLETNPESYNKAFCRNGTNTLNIDLDGNLYQCHNNWKKIGTIHSGYLKYIAKATKVDKITQNNYQTECKNCEVLPLCKTGCPLITKEIRQKTKFCELRKALFQPIIKLNEAIIQRQGDFLAVKKEWGEIFHLR